MSALSHRPYVGLMSGTSLDGVDAALVDLSARPRLLGTHFLPYPKPIQSELLALAASGEDELERSARLSIELTELYARSTRELLARADTTGKAVAAIGCHGQTVRHRPEAGYSIQLCNPSLLAELTGITVIADFRGRDIAAGGQGAPLVPAFHAACFRDQLCHRVIVNIGGIANLTNLPPLGPVTGFDTGPGNLLLDLWTRIHLGRDFDADGAWARSGRCVPSLLEAMLADEFFKLRPPKSTGRDRYSERWLASFQPDRFSSKDVQATLTELTARSIAGGIAGHCPGTSEVYVCGGGASNGALLGALQAGLGEIPIRTTAALGLDPDWIEAMAFAWLARRTLAHQPGNLPEVTGASGARILGGIYPG